jgi:hypothetical protein
VRSRREQTNAILEAGQESRGHQSPNPPACKSPEPAALDPMSLLKRWHGKLSKLGPLSPAEGFRSGDWADLVDHSWWLYENFASVAVRQGWGVEGQWGVRIGLPHGGGLAQLMRTSRSVLFADRIATITRLGIRTTRNPECAHGCRLVWEI